MTQNVETLSQYLVEGLRKNTEYFIESISRPRTSGFKYQNRNFTVLARKCLDDNLC